MAIRCLLSAVAVLLIASVTCAEESTALSNTGFDQPGATPGELQRLPPVGFEGPSPEETGQPDEPHHYTGFIDLNYYWDTRQFNTLTINAGANLPYDVEYFQFLNLNSQLDDAGALEDLEGFYTEMHFRRPIAKDSRWLKPLDWTVMYADGTGIPDVTRLGIRWRTHDTPGGVGDFLTEQLKLEYSLNFHVVESDGSGIQLEHFYRRFFFDNRLYVSGFADHDVNNDGSDTWVAEHQLGVKLVGQWFAVAEYRYNAFLPDEQKSGWGFGVEYLIQFD